MIFYHGNGACCDKDDNDICFNYNLNSGDNYKGDINVENPLGTGGRLAVVFATLLRKLWSGKEKSLSPFKLKVSADNFHNCCSCRKMPDDS